jgi:CheY-like chemotaxis protein
MTVLVVDDDVDVRETIRDVVTLIGRSVVTAEDGAAALRALDQPLDNICLILLDLVMPGMDGWQLLRTIRQDAKHARVPVVVISAHAGSHPPEGATALLRKPVDLHVLVETVQAHCGRKHGASPA